MWKRVVRLALVILAVAVAGSPSPAASTVTAKTRLTIKLKETQMTESSGVGSFELLGSSAADADSGKITFTQRVGRKGTTADGLVFLTVPRTETLRGRRGTLVLRSSPRVVNVGVLEQDDTISTGTWSIVRGTGAYAGLTGGGSLVGMITAMPAGSTACVGYSCYSHSYRYEGRVARR